MALPLGWTLQEDDGYALVRVHGRFDPSGTPGLRSALLEALAEQPDALLVELSATDLRDPAVLSMFTAVARQAAQWPGTPLLICAPPSEVAVPLEPGRYGRLPVYATVADARRSMAEGHAVAPSLSDQLLPISGAARHGRDMAKQACLAWGLPELVGPATLVISELVSNAVEHAGTTMTAQLTRRMRYVHVTVRDGSVEPPVLAAPAGLSDRGRGLMLVESTAVHWGWLPSRDGKVVWAALGIVGAAGPPA